MRMRCLFVCFFQAGGGGRGVEYRHVAEVERGLNTTADVVLGLDEQNLISLLLGNLSRDEASQAGADNDLREAKCVQRQKIFRQAQCDKHRQSGANNTQVDERKCQEQRNYNVERIGGRNLASHGSFEFFFVVSFPIEVLGLQ